MLKERHEKYMQIIERAKKMGITREDSMSHLMDIESADIKFNLRLEEWLQADNFNFIHDFLGIYDNVGKENFGFFVPRFCGKK